MIIAEYHRKDYASYYEEDYMAQSKYCLVETDLTLDEIAARLIDPDSEYDTIDCDGGRALVLLFGKAYDTIEELCEKNYLRLTGQSETYWRSMQEPVCSLERRCRLERHRVQVRGTLRGRTHSKLRADRH